MDILLDKRLKSMEEGIASIACDLNIIKCMLLTEYAEKRGIDVKKLAKDLNDIYHKGKNNDS